MAQKQSIWKPRLFRLGLLLTLLIIAGDWAQALRPFENILYARRARYCRRFTPPPTDRILHLDIDNDTLDTVGAWPWSRATFAKIIDEISLTKPKVIGLDMYFPDVQKDEVDKNTGEVIANDDLFAASAKRAGNVLI